MDVLSLPDLKELSRHGGGPLVSLYMRTQPFGPDSQLENVGRLKNLLREAASRLEELGLRSGEIYTLLDPVRKLADDRPFWLRADKGLAIFADGAMRVYRLPAAPPESVTVGSRFHLRPLLTLLGGDRHYYLLALSQKRARLLRGSANGLEELTLGDAPSSLADELKWDDFEKRSLQYHSGMSNAPGGRRPAVFHSSGEPEPKDEILRYFRDIDRAIVERLRDGAPLVLAAVDFVLPLYREVNTYRALAADAVSGSPDSLTDEILHARSLAIATAAFHQDRREAASRVEELWATPRTTSDPSTLLPAVFRGRVETLFVNNDAALWGIMDESTENVEVHTVRQPDDQDLLELAALRTIVAGGVVYPVTASEMPRDPEAPAVALLRY
ncbi:MAG: hypothetical protein LLG08_07510 [Actinomycetia bacterium]|nr:hypothetical protein [Actinomycetes bacterium]